MFFWLCTNKDKASKTVLFETSELQKNKQKNQNKKKSEKSKRYFHIIFCWPYLQKTQKTAVFNEQRLFFASLQVLNGNSSKVLGTKITLQIIEENLFILAF